MKIKTMITPVLFGTLFLMLLHCGSSTKPEESVARKVPILINEFMASNVGIAGIEGVVDDSGKHADWIELYNNSDTSFSLLGLFISDSTIDPMKFPLEDTLLPPRGYYIVWADGDTTDGPSHANFHLSASRGEQVVLSLSPDSLPFFDGQDSSIIIDSITFLAGTEATITNQSWGRIIDGSETWGPQSKPTPRSENLGRVSTE